MSEHKHRVLRLVSKAVKSFINMTEDRRLRDRDAEGAKGVWYGYGFLTHPHPTRDVLLGI